MGRKMENIVQYANRSERSRRIQSNPPDKSKPTRSIFFCELIYFDYAKKLRIYYDHFTRTTQILWPEKSNECVLKKRLI